jgi:type IV secretory pathway VirB2 component (pilin)
MKYLRGPLYLDITAKGLCILGAALMIFGRGGWFYAGVATVVLGVLFIGASLMSTRHLRQRGWDGTKRS